MNEQEIFHSALALPPEARADYLDRACDGDASLRAAVDGLLRAHENAHDFLGRPPTALGGTVDDAPGAKAGSVVAGRYKLLDQIGEGGMGTVWVAEQREPVKRQVALKVVKPGMDSKSVLARFEAERQALAVMEHPNIAKVLDGGVTDQGRPFFVMELVKGMPLTEYCDGRRLSVRERLELFVAICQAVQHAHQKGIIHRDLKPSNILVTEHDGRPIPKVIDFGLAKALSAATTLTERTLHTAFGATMGTPLYMAPEQVGINALDVDTRSDVYSLGVILYELLTGTTPLEKQRLKEAAWDEIRRVIREEEPPRPSVRLSDSHETLPSISAHRHTEPAALTKLIRGELDWIVMKALEKDRNRRYETANGFSMDVQRYLADEPVQACPPSTAYRLRKFVRRNKAPVVAVGLILLSLAAGIVGTTFGLVEARRWAKAEKQARDEADDFRRRETDRAEREKKEKLDAQARLEKALQVASGTLGGEHPHTIHNLISLAKTYLGAGQFNQALPLFEQAHGLAKARFVVDHVETLGSANELAEGYLAAGKLDEAVRLLENSLRWRSNRRQTMIRPPDGQSQHVLKMMDNLVRAYRATGKTDKLLALLEEALILRTVTNGADALETRKSAGDLAEAYRAAGKPNEALAIVQSLVGPRDKLGAGQPPSFVTMNALAMAYRDAGKWEESRATLREAAILLEKRRFQHPDAAAIVRNLITNLDGFQHLKEAEVWRRKLLPCTADRFGADSREYATELSGLAANLDSQKRFTEAETYLREVLAIREKNEPNTSAILRDRLWLVEVLVRQRKHTEAEPLLLQGYEELRRLKAKHPESVTLAVQRNVLTKLVQLYDALGKPTEAATWRKELNAIPEPSTESTRSAPRVRMPLDKPPRKPESLERNR